MCLNKTVLPPRQDWAKHRLFAATAFFGAGFHAPIQTRNSFTHVQLDTNKAAPRELAAIWFQASKAITAITGEHW